jgi:nicotinamidase-related amidase
LNIDGFTCLEGADPMKRMDSTRSTLVLVDFQVRLMPTIRDAASVVEEAVFLGRIAPLVGVRVLGTEQNPAGLGDNLPQIRALCERTLAKTHFDACRDGLLAALRETRADAGDVVIAGCEAHVCLLQTALGLRRAGVDVFVVAPACGSRRGVDHERAMCRLEQAGAAIVTPEMVAFEWLDSCESPAFRPALALLKQRSAATPGA